MSENKKTLSKAFVDNYDNVNEDVAREQVVVATQKIRELEKERDNDEKLAAAKQIVKDMNAAYTSAVKYERAKINFFLEKIEEIEDGEVNPTGNS